MSDLKVAISELKRKAFTLRIYNQRLVLIYLDKAVGDTSQSWYEVAAKAWPILVSDEAVLHQTHSKRLLQARRKLLDQARSKIMLALSKDLIEAETLLDEASRLHLRAEWLLESPKLKGLATALMVLAGY